MKLGLKVLVGVVLWGVAGCSGSSAPQLPPEDVVQQPPPPPPPPPPMGGRGGTGGRGGAGGMGGAGGAGGMTSPPALEINSMTQDFGQIVVGNDSAPFSFVITNKGGSTAGALAAAVSGANAEDFPLESNGCQMALEAGKSCTVQVKFRPTGAGDKSATLVVTGGMAMVMATLKGAGLAVGTLTIIPDAHDFGTVPMGMAAPAASFTVMNTGGMATGVVRAQVVGDPVFTLGTNSCATVEPGMSCTVTVTFLPTAVGDPRATLEVEAMPGGKATASLSGKAIPPPIGPKLTFDANTKNFGDVVVGETRPLAFFLKNIGDTAAGPVNFEIAGTNPRQFMLGDNDCPQALAPNALCTLTLIFAPTSTGAKSMILRATATPGGEATATVRGNGLGPAKLDITPVARNFGAVLEGSGQFAEFDFTVTNSGGQVSGALSATVTAGATDFSITPAPSNDCAGRSLIIGGNCRLRVRFLPVGTGDKTGTLSVSGTPGGVVTATLTGRTLVQGQLAHGLTYQYFEGTWNVLPNFDQLTAIETGTVDTFDLGPRNRNDLFGFVYSGYLQVASAGSYTFFVASDDGSRLYIDGQLVVDNDGIHTQFETQGMVTLSAGFHTIEVRYFDRQGPESLLVSYSGPGLAKQAVPNMALYREMAAPPPPPPQQLVAGLDYEYFEGSWNALPDFDQLAPVETGSVATFDLSVRNRDDLFGIEFSGFITIPTDGDYTFFLNSNDGSKLFIDGAEVVNNDGVHATQERMGTITLAAGNHAIEVLFFEATGSELLEVAWQGPGFGRQPVPASALLHPPQRMPAIDPGVIIPGLDYRAFEGTWTSLPDFAQLTPVQTGTTDNFDLAARTRDNNFGLEFTGYINVDSDGEYTFYTTSDEGSRLYIDGQLVVDNDGIHTARERQGLVSLAAGYHAIRVAYFDASLSHQLSVSWEGPGITKQAVPNGVLFHPPAALPAQMPGTVEPGIDYRAFEGSWSVLPDFSLLTPVATGSVANFDLSVRSRDDAFGLEFTGFVQAPADGDYIFFTNSDDGSRLYVDGQLVVDNDGAHNSLERQGTVKLAAGLHAIRVAYFDGSASHSLAVSWQGPGFARQPISNTALFRVPPTPAVNPGTTSPGLSYRYFHGTWTALPNFSSLTPIESGNVTNVTLSVRNRDDNFALEFTGYIKVDLEGEYTFFTNSNEGSRLYVDGQLIVDNDGIHAARERQGTIKLAAGFHALRVTFFEATGGQSLEVRYQGPGITKQLVPDGALFRN